MKMEFYLALLEEKLCLPILKRIIDAPLLYVYKRFRVKPGMTMRGVKKLSKNLLITYLVVFIALSSITGLFLFNPWSTKETQAAWFNDNWSYRKIIPITANTGIDTASYVAVTLTNTNTLVSDGQLQSDCGDMRFTKFGGEILPYYISSGCNSASTVVHVYFDTLPAGASDFYFYYGNPSAVDGFSATAFSTPAVSVTVGSIGSEEKGPSPTGYWKFDDAQGTTAQDSTSNNYDGTLSGTPTWRTEDECISGKCLRFSGSSQHVSTTTTGSLVTATDGTMSVWLKPRGTSPTATDVWDTDGIFADAGGDMGIYRGIIGGLDRIWIYNYDGNQDLIGITYNTNEWVQISWVHTGGTLYAYKNGNLISSTASGNTDLNNPIDIGKGMDAGANGTFEGDIDEVKIYRNGLSAAQILANYNARSNPEGVSSALGANTQNMPGALSNGLTGYWKMDESSWTGDCSTDSALDSSGNSLHGDACPNASAPSPGAGKFGNGGNFDGTNDYISIPDGSSVEPSGDMTLSAWVKFDTLPGAGVDDKIVFKYEAVSPFVGYELTYNGDGYFYLARENAAQDYEFAYYTITAATNTWYHIVGTKRADKVHLFVNSVYNESESGSSSGLLYNTSGVLAIGSTSTGNYLDGTIDEVRLYNRSLSNNEIAQLYNWAPGPVGYWKMDEGTWTNDCSTSSVIDSSGNGLNGKSCPNSLGISAPTTAKYGKGGTFDGSNDFIEIADNAILKPTTAITVSAWIKPGTGYNTDYRVIAMKGQAGHSLRQYALDLGPEFNNKARFSVYASSTESNVTSTSTLTENQWYYVTGVYDSSLAAGSRVKIYLNGKLDATASGPASMQTNTDAVTIGRIIDGQDPFLGNIDDVKIYNYPRNAGQIVEDMNAGHPAPGSPVGTPVGFWKFNEGVNDTCSGGSNDACNSGSGGSTYDGTSTATRTNSGKLSRALDFDGTDDVVTITNADGIDMNTNLANFTFSSWVYPDTDGEADTGQIFNKGANTYLRVDSQGTTDLDLECNLDRATTDTNVNITDGLTTATWSHVACAWDGTTLSVFINGKLRGSSTSGSGAISADANDLLIGGGTSNNFDGKIDEFKAYNSALTASQMALDVNAASGQVLGATGNNSTAGAVNAASQEYCIPGDSTTCTAPVARWDFEEGVASGGTNYDTSGNANNCSTDGAIGVGKVGKARNYTEAVRVSCGTGSSLADLAALTAEAWVYPRDMGEFSYGTIFTKNDYGGAGGWGLIFDGSTTNGIQFFADYTGTDLYLPTANNALTLNTWNHVAVTWSGGQATSTAHIYVNGKEVTYGTGTDATGTRISDSTNTLFIGESWGQNNGFDGIIDQARIFGYVRTPAQINYDMNRGAPIAHWKMDECQGTTINDSSGNSLSGTLTVGASGTYTSPGTCSVSSATSAWYNGAAGKRNYSLAFDGTDEIVDFGTPSKLDLRDSIGMAVWVKPDSTSLGASYHAMIGNYDGGGTTAQYEFAFNAGAISYNYGSASSYVEYIPTSTVSFTAGNWYHIVFTHSGSNSTGYFYVNGVKYATTRTGSATIPTFGFSNTTLGRGGPSGDYFSGQIDDFKIFNYTLNDTQVKNLYNDGVTRYGPVTGAP